MEIAPQAVVPISPEKMTKKSYLISKDRAPRVAALVYEGLCTFEYGIAAEVFGLPRPELGGDLYRFTSVALDGKPVRATGGLIVTATGSRADLERADIVIVPGWRGKDAPVPENLCDEIRAAHDRGARIVSICSGVYVLAAAGLLVGRRVTTHWRYSKHFETKFPDAIVQPNELYVDEGDIVTSAGSSAGIDACLHVVRSDYGAKIANSVARRLVMHAHRQGGQAQFIEQPVPKLTGNHRLSEMMDKVRGKLANTHQIASMAELAGMSSRTFQRRFLAFTGLPAMQWLTQERISHACQQLEVTDLSIETVSQNAGFGNAETLRYHFRQVLSVSPVEYRKRFSAPNSLKSGVV